MAPRHLPPQKTDGPKNRRRLHGGRRSRPNHARYTTRNVAPNPRRLTCPFTAAGVTECSYGWSIARAQPRDAQPVDSRSGFPSAPDGAEEECLAGVGPAHRKTMVRFTALPGTCRGNAQSNTYRSSNEAPWLLQQPQQLGLEVLALVMLALHRDVLLQSSGKELAGIAVIRPGADAREIHAIIESEFERPYSRF